MVVIDEHHDHDMGESSMCRDPHDMGESSMHLDAQVDNQMVILPEHLQHSDDSDELQPSPNGTPYWVPDVPEDEKPKKGRFFDNFNDAFEMYQVYSQKARFNIRKAGFKRKNGQITHSYVECNRAGKPRRSKEVNTLNEVDVEDVEIPGNKKRKRRTNSQAISCPAKLCLKRIIGTETYMVLDFVENHNHPLMNLNNMDLSKARRQLHFDDYIFIHRASLSNLGPTRAHRLKVALVGGYDKVRGTSTDYCNFKRCVNSFIGDRDAQMLVDTLYINISDDSDEFRPTPNGTPYWVPNVPEDEKPKKGFFFDNYNDAFEMYQLYSEKARFNIRKAGFKRKNGQITHSYIECNRARKPRRAKKVNTLNQDDGEDGEVPGTKKRKRMTKSQAINCPAKLCLKKIIGTESYMVLDFVENHNHPLMNLNNMDLSKARRQLHFDDYIFIHRASLSNLGPTRAHRLKVALVGGYDKVRGTSTDYCNFKRCVNSFIGDRDAQMLVDKMCKRKNHVPEFCFEYHTLPSKELVRLFWADETMKCNYVAFGDVVSFDATFRTNKYGYKFVPFTGINNHQKCVTFGAALLSDETTKSFCWMLEAFLKTHKKQPPFAVTDQDGALRYPVVKMFPDSHHRLCMWHITEKLPGKVLGDLAADTNFRKDFHKLIRNHFEGSVETCIIRHRDKRSNTVTDATVVLNQMDHSVTCSCGHYNRHGFLCRRVFCVFHIYGIVKIPDLYLNRRWTKNVLPAHLLDKRHRYGPCIEETDTLASQVHQTIEDCISFVRNDTDKLSELLSTVKELKKKLEDETQTPNVDPNKEALYADMLGVTVPDKVVIKTPRSIFRSKGTRRMKSAAEIGKAKTIARTNRKVPFKRRTCSKCGGKGHNKATCKGCSACGEAGHHKGICKKFSNQDKDEVDDEDEGDNEDEVDDEDGVDNEDELDEDEDDEEYISEEE
ncbi:FAR1-related sequence 5-like protein [Tanacetum coccineum]|uniref:FAR1-related sequence 5-like protein n=1 Tax=Tanacetum coccineum TaxID=301880 RepID=A0ABQ5C0E7_9ASTR